jgi:hypothetical protein
LFNSIGNYFSVQKGETIRSDDIRAIMTIVAAKDARELRMLSDRLRSISNTLRSGLIHHFDTRLGNSADMRDSYGS